MANLTSYKDIIDQCHLRVLDSLKTLDNELSNNIGRALEREIDNTASHKQHAIALDSAFIYKKSKHIINESFSEQLNSGFKKFKTNELDTQVRENEFHKEAWSLVDDDVLEETISIRSLSSEANQLHKDKIWQLEQRLTFLNKGLPINESSNPMSPLQFFSALRFGLKKAPIDISGKIVCYKSLSECLIKRYANLLNIVNTILIQEDILPGLNYANQHSSIAGNEPPTQKKNELHTVEEKDKVYPLPDGSAETSNDIVQNNNGVENGNRSEPVESISNNDVQDTNTSGSSQIPLVNAIRNLLQRARKLSDEDVAVPVPINHQQHTTEQIGEKVEQALTDATTESLTNTPLSDATTTLGIARGETVTPEPATQQPIDDRTLTQEPIIF
ncbi:MAG: hypothetical protein ACJA0C_001280, partial [Candidatus Endobugula sp.]